jgi:hypothetical protein
MKAGKMAQAARRFMQAVLDEAENMDMEIQRSRNLVESHFKREERMELISQ